MTVLNFAEPLSRDSLSTLSALCGRKARRTVDLAAEFDDALPLAEQVRAMLDGIGLSASDWQNQAMVVNLPPDPVTAALLVAEIAGRRGRTPSILRWRRMAPGAAPEPAEVISLHEIRKEARHMRKGWGLLGGRGKDRS
ncbi:MAG: hypothetical protein FJX72_07775 [Armatimonadetes bacterium]|nr:hypothetical protein [Armatimonadota bacterium]